MTRYEDWEQRLARFLCQRTDKPFSWADNNCALFVCDAVREMTGVDLAAEFRGTFSDGNGAKAVLCKNGGVEEIAASVARSHGLEEIEPLKAQRGDAVSLDDADGPILGLVSMNGHLVIVITKHGVAYRHLRDARRAWRIG